MHLYKRQELRRLLNEAWENSNGTVHHNNSIYKMQDKHCLYKNNDEWLVKLTYEDSNATFNAEGVLKDMTSKEINKNIYRKYRKRNE